MQVATWANRAVGTARLCRFIASAQVTGNVLQRVELGSSVDICRAEEPHTAEDGCSTSGRLPALASSCVHNPIFPTLATMCSLSQQRGFSSHAQCELSSLLGQFSLPHLQF